jgi:hypothetical protein
VLSAARPEKPAGQFETFNLQRCRGPIALCPKQRLQPRCFKLNLHGASAAE